MEHTCLQVVRHLIRVLPNGPQRKREVDYVLDKISETMTPMHYHAREVIFSTFQKVSEMYLCFREMLRLSRVLSCPSLPLSPFSSLILFRSPLVFFLILLLLLPFTSPYFRLLQFFIFLFHLFFLSLPTPFHPVLPYIFLSSLLSYVPINDFYILGNPGYSLARFSLPGKRKLPCSREFRKSSFSLVSDWLTLSTTLRNKFQQTTFPRVGFYLERETSN